MDFDSKIRVVEDFPKAGISFKDITTLLKDGEAYHEAINACAKLVEAVDYDLIIGPEARGFLIGAPLSYLSKKGFVPVRKPGKLPAETLSYEYALEYGTDVLQIHKDAIQPGQRVLIADDLLATGGTVGAVAELIKKSGGIVAGYLFLIELTFLNGKDNLSDAPTFSVLKY